MKARLADKAGPGKEGGKTYGKQRGEDPKVGAPWLVVGLPGRCHRRLGLKGGRAKR